MAEMCAQRAREAAEKEVQRGKSTARTKWSEGEINKFKAALAKFGPDSNIKISAAIGTRTAAQVNVFKWRFFRAHPSWIRDNYHPASPAANVPSPSCSSSLSRRTSPQTQEDRSPPVPSVIQAPPAANARFGCSSESRTPPGPIAARGHRIKGTRAPTAPTGTLKAEATCILVVAPTNITRCISCWETAAYQGFNTYHPLPRLWSPQGSTAVLGWGWHIRQPLG